MDMQKPKQNENEEEDKQQQDKILIKKNKNSNSNKQEQIKDKQLTFIKKQYCILHIMGPHAQENEETIFQRKKRDIDLCGKTFWFARSFKIHQIDQLIQKNKSINEETYVIFIAPSQKGGAKDTKTEDPARQYCADLDKKTWINLPSQISPLTGLITDNSCALVFDELQNFDIPTQKVNLWDYAQFQDQNKPLKFQLGITAIISVLKDMSKCDNKMKKNIRDVVAIARLDKNTPCVWIRK